jgi:hypothetical protein
MSSPAVRMATRRWRKRLLIFCVTLVVAALATWTVMAFVRSKAIYVHVKAGGRGWRGHVHTSDPWLGLCPAPNGAGAETFSIGPDVPSRIDADGFRVPVEAPDAAERRRPLVLALGCSFTYGASVLAEETFAWRVAEALGGSCLNAGICSGGAAHVLLRARELVPKYHPEWVLVQDSPWLSHRSRQRYADIHVGLLPTPHFVRTSSGVELVPPVFATIVFDLPIAEYRDTPRGTGDFLSFCARVGLPMLAHDDWHQTWLALEDRLGVQPPFATNAEIVAFVYPEIARICRENGARMLVVNIDSKKPGQSYDLSPVIAGLGVLAVACGRRLVAELPDPSRETYVRTYTLMRGDPPRSVDGHPNPHAHALIADEILRTIAAAR